MSVLMTAIGRIDRSTPLIFPFETVQKICSNLPKHFSSDCRKFVKFESILRMHGGGIPAVYCFEDQMDPTKAEEVGIAFVSVYQSP